MGKLLDKLRRVQAGGRPFCTMIVPAAGSSARMGGGDKLMMELEGVPVLVRTLRALDAAQLVDEIIIATREDRLLEVADLCRRCGLRKPVRVVQGGENRTQSVLAAACEADAKAQFIAVHDGARPLVLPEDVDAVIRFACQTHAAAPALPVTDTVKTADETGRVTGTPDRSTLFAVQTPQVFQADVLKAALQSAAEAKLPLTDDCAAVERLGKQVYLLPGNPENIKITRPLDLAVAAAILRQRGAERMTNLRIGHGYDVHRLVPGRPLILGGVHVDYDRGLDGHSDADVLVHAVMDALLGAAGLADIGTLFPDSDAALLNVSSILLLERVAQKLAESRVQVVNIDATLIAQAPKIAPYRAQMRRNIARALGIDPEQVGVKATTEEHLGFTGDGSGMAAHAVALVERN